MEKELILCVYTCQIYSLKLRGVWRARRSILLKMTGSYFKINFYKYVSMANKRIKKHKHTNSTTWLQTFYPISDIRNYTVDLMFGCNMVPFQWNPRNFSNCRTELGQNLYILSPVSIYIFLKKKWNEFNYQDYYLFQTDTL